MTENAAPTGLSCPTFCKAIDLFAEGGWTAIKPAARGRSAGDGSLLCKERYGSYRAEAEGRGSVSVPAAGGHA